MGCLARRMNLPSLLAKSVSLILCTALVGCASVVNGGSQQVAITSAPDNARVSIVDPKGKYAFTGTTPCTADLERGAGYFQGAHYVVKVAKDGYTPFETRIHSSVSGWYAGNVVLGGLLGFIVIDPLTGGMWSLDPESIHADLKGRNASFFPKGPGIHVVLRKDVPAALASHLKPLPRKS